MTYSTVLNHTDRPLVLDTVGHIVGGREYASVDITAPTAAALIASQHLHVVIDPGGNLSGLGAAVVAAINRTRALNGTPAQSRLPNVSAVVGKAAVPVASRNSTYYGGLFGSTGTQTYRTNHRALCDITSLQLGYANYYGTSAGSQGDGPGDLTVSCSVEVPLGTIYRGYFGQTRAGVIKPGGRVLSDPIGVVIPKGTYFYVRTYVSGNWPLGITSNYAKGLGQDTVGDGNNTDSNEGIASPNFSDVTAAGNVNSSYTLTYSPNIILGTTPNDRVPCVVLIGDSVCSYSNEAPDMGWFIRAVANQYPYLRISNPGETAQQWAVDGTAANLVESRLGLLKYGTHCVFAHGRNDVTAGRTLAQIQADLITGWTRAHLMGAAAYQATVTPKVSSTDNYTTVANQTPDVHDAVRIALNNWLRDNAPMLAGAAAATGSSATGTLRAGDVGHPLSGYIEMADVVESARDSGKWKVDRVRTVTDGAMTSGTKVLTSAAANFSETPDIGTGVFVAGAGSAGATLAGVIASIQSESSVTTSPTSGTTVAGATVQIGTATYDGTHPNGDRHRDMAAVAAVTLDAAIAHYTAS